MPEPARGPFRWLFEDRTTGRIVVAQMPNPALWIALLALAAETLLPTGRLVLAARVVMFVALVSWAFDELTRGVNPWRRLLGAGTLVALVVWFVILKN